MKKEMKARIRISMTILALCGLGLAASPTAQAVGTGYSDAGYTAGNGISITNSATNGDTYAIIIDSSSSSYLTFDDTSKGLKLTIADSITGTGSTSLVTDGQVYSYVNGFIGGVIGNSDVTNSGKLVTGQTVYDYLHQEEVAIGKNAAIGVGAKNAVAIGGGATNSDGAYASGESSIALGAVSQAYGKGSVALGVYSYAGKTGNVATDVDMYATALGYSSNAGALYSISIGDSYVSEDANQGIAIGKNAIVGTGATNAVAIGGGNDETEEGYGSYAGGQSSVALGNSSRAYGKGSVALGYSSLAGVSGTASDADMYATALGYSSQAEALYSISIGDSYVASAANQGIAIGKSAVVTAANGVAIGYEAVAADSRTDVEKAADATARIQTVSFGHKKGEYAGYYKDGYGNIVDEETAKIYNEMDADELAKYKAVNYESDSFARLTNVADGVSNTDAATVGQVAKTGQTVTLSDAQREEIEITDNGTTKKVSVKNNTIVSNDGAVLATFSLADANNLQNDTGFVSGGTLYNYVNGLSTGVIGSEFTENSGKLVTGQTVYNYLHQETVAIGKFSTASGNSSISLGDNSNANGKGSVAVGLYSLAGSNGTEASVDLYATALGYSSHAEALYSISIGDSYVASAANQGIAIGRSAQALAINAVAIGYEAVATDSRTDDEKKPEATARIQTVSFGHKNGDTYYEYNYGDYKSNTYSTTVLSRLTNVADGVSNTDAATVGQIIKEVTAATSDNKKTVQTALLKFNDSSKTSLSIAVAGEGKVEKDDVRLISGDTLYVETRKFGSTRNYLNSLNSAAGNLTNLDKVIGNLEKNGYYIKKMAVDQQTVSANLSALDTAIGAKLTGTYNAIKKEKSVTENLALLDAAIGNAGISTGNLISYDSDTSTIKIGAGADIGATYVSFANSGGTSRKLTGVAAGEKETEAANFGQIAAAGQMIYASNAEIEASNGKKKNIIYDNTGKEIATFSLSTVADLDADDTGFVSGGVLYNYLHQEKVSIGKDSGAFGNYSIALGDAAKAYGKGSMALGYGAKAGTDAITDAETEVDATAIGRNAKAEGYFSTAVGDNSDADGAYSTAVGHGSVASGTGSVAVGNGNYVVGNTVTEGTSETVSGYNVAVGKDNYVYGEGSGAYGYWNTVGNITTKYDYTYVLGYKNTVSNSRNVVLGSENTISGSATIAIGKKINTSAQNAIVLGGGTDSEITAVANNSVVLGYGSTSENADTVSVGSATLQRKIVHVAAGEADTDVATVGQLKSTVSGAQYTVAVAEESKDALTVSKDEKAKTWTIKANTANVSSSSNALVTGAQVDSYVTGLISTQDISENNEKLVKGSQVYSYVNNLIGGEVTMSGDKSEKLVTGAAVATAINEATSTLNSTIGNLNTAIGEKLTQDGNVITASNSIIGNISALDTKIGKIPVKTEGSYNKIDASKSISENLVAIDSALNTSGVDVSHLKEITRSDGAEVKGTNSLALGKDAKAWADNSIVFGTGSTVMGKNSIAIGTGHEISGDNSGAFGDPTYIDADNSYAIGNGNQIDLGADGSFIVGNNNKIFGEKTFVIGNDVKTTVSNAVILGDGSTATEDNVVSVGSETNRRKIVNVAAGEADTDAATVGQLKDAMNSNMGEVGRALGTLDSRVNKVAAGAAALAALHPEDFNPEDKWSFAVGYGHYRDANAGAFGVFYKPNMDTTVSLASTIGNGNTMMNAGVSFKLGQRGVAPVKPDARIVQKLTAENAAQAKALDAQARKIETLEADNEKIKADNAQMKADNAQMKADNEKMKAQIAEILKKLETSGTVQKSM